MKRMLAAALLAAFLAAGTPGFADDREDQFDLLIYLQSVTASDMKEVCTRRFPVLGERFDAVIGPWMKRYADRIEKGRTLYEQSFKADLDRILSRDSGKEGNKDSVPDERLRPACDKYLHDMEIELEEAP
jgi:hypothetical protein